MVNRCALIVLYDGDGSMLLQKRSMGAKRIPGYWGFFGGGIRDGESPLAAVVREAREEIGYDLRDPELFFEQPFYLNSQQQTVVDGTEEGYMWAFTEKYFGRKENLVLGEGASLAWVRPVDAGSLKMLRHDFRVIEALDLYIQGPS